VVLRAWSLWSRSTVRQYVVQTDIWFSVGRQRRESWVEMALSKPPPGSSRGPSAAVDGLDLFGDCPELRGYLLDRVYADGGARQTATITLFLNDQGALGAILKDRDNDRAIFGSGLSLDEVAYSLELQLASPGTPWRADKQATGSSKRIRPT